jgi:hypothetical protein
MANEMSAQPQPSTFVYSPWRHGGWYVDNVRYPDGSVGCVSRNYPDKKWRIVCDPRGFDDAPTFRSRDEAASAEWQIANSVIDQVTSTTLAKRPHQGPLAVDAN